MSSTVKVAETIRKATAASVDPLADTLAEAFHTDPVLSWVYPDADRRAQILPQAFRMIVAAALPHGGIDTVADDVAGAIWIPPGIHLDDEQLGEDLGLISGEYVERFFTLQELMDRRHPTDEVHQYLFILGTRQAWQSQGIGSALLHVVLADCDQTGMPAYLEATSERNRDLYLRHGFEITDVLPLPDGPSLYCMWRTPGDPA